MLVVRLQPSQAAHFTVNTAQEEFYWTGREGKTRRDMELWSSAVGNSKCRQAGRWETEAVRQALSVNTNARSEHQQAEISRGSHRNSTIWGLEGIYYQATVSSSQEDRKTERKLVRLRLMLELWKYYSTGSPAGQWFVALEDTDRPTYWSPLL